MNIETTTIDMVRVTISHITAISFILSFAVIYMIVYAFPPKWVLKSSDFMQKGTNDRSDDKDVKDQRYSNKGKQSLLLISFVGALIISIIVYLLHKFALY